MGAKILEGKPIAQKIKEEVKAEVEKLKAEGVTPCLAAVQVGEDPASKSYIRSQRRSCKEVGIEYKLFTLPENTSKEELKEFIEKLNNDPSITGIILQMPLPKHIDAREAFCWIDEKKDVEGVTPANLGLIAFDMPRLAPPTALAAIRMIEETGEEVLGRETVVVGRSTIVGKPAALLLLQRKFSATVTVCHTGTSKRGKLEEHVRNAEILIAAAGQPHLIKGEWVKEGAIVVDVGMNYVEGKFVGDVEFETAKERASYITPVPGGVGPVTTAILLRNVVEAVKWQREG
ncbi:bifunctional 5,10-methylenetetrahydrofolate dehydrogenase/5,10-methenyltetrahydrofolate cyclohydrolase [Candidatus Poribacteria bacterium]|nr:MAG: bifunctional 5,10-methylenetetrahydrofolate dehydrogenase/5,10-methenyltetrahydrofolate cyclohydrolase [Candidatus Poribacteria bacterium]